jgi:hypothetical protein
MALEIGLQEQSLGGGELEVRRGEAREEGEGIYMYIEWEGGGRANG